MDAIYINNVKEKKMNNYIEGVKEFMILFNQPIIDKPNIMSEDRNKLRIALIFEELKEYAEASGLSDYFVEELCVPTLTQFSNFTDKEIYQPVIDLTEQFDALLDLQYVLSGAVLENGFGNIFDKGFDEVHRSNMSKACNTFDEIEKTKYHYRMQNIVTYYNEEIDFPKPLYRKEDNKVLKSINYSPANLLSIIENGY